MTQELIAQLREDYCSCIDGYKSRGMTDPQCSSCDSKDWREECADALERLIVENAMLKMVLSGVKQDKAVLTAHDQFLADANKVWVSKLGATAVCGCCHGSGWVVRDSDIGTDQECFVCEGSGVVHNAI